MLALAGSIAVEENGHFYNRFYFVHPDGQVQWYDKKHLFTYGGEHKSFTAGAERVIVNFRVYGFYYRFAMIFVFRSGREIVKITT